MNAQPQRYIGHWTVSGEMVDNLGIDECKQIMLNDCGLVFVGELSWIICTNKGLIIEETLKLHPEYIDLIKQVCRIHNSYKFRLEGYAHNTEATKKEVDTYKGSV